MDGQEQQLEVGSNNQKVGYIMKKRTDKEEELLVDIKNILKEPISATEQTILIAAKEQLEKGEYFPKIVKDLETNLTLLAAQKKLSKHVGDLYLKITSHLFKNKGFGHGFFTVFGINH